MKKCMVYILVGAGIIIYMAGCKAETKSDHPTGAQPSPKPPFSEEEVR